MSIINAGDIILTANEYGTVFILKAARSAITGRLEWDDMIGDSATFNRKRGLSLKADRSRFIMAPRFTPSTIQKSGADFVAAHLSQVGECLPAGTRVVWINGQALREIGRTSATAHA